MAPEPVRQPLLFEAYPDLAESIGWVWLGTSPTPVERLTHLGHSDLWIKRDDLATPLYGGNKVYRLEFLLGDAISQGRRHVMVSGGIGTNLGVAAAIFCRNLGLRCTLLLLDQPPTSDALRNLLVSRYHGAELRYRKHQWRGAVEYFIGMRLLHPQAYFIYPGGSSPVGTLGTVNAALEFARQIDQGICPVPDHVICPTASSGTMAGLAVGFMLAGLKTKVTGVLVGPQRIGPLVANSPRTVSRLAGSVCRLMRRNAPAIPDVTLEEPVMRTEYLGEGYGRPTPEGARAAQTFRERENIGLDLTYTAKTCAALLDLIETPPYRESTVLYWHTYNSVDLDRRAASVEVTDLPPELQDRFRETADEGCSR